MSVLLFSDNFDSSGTLDAAWVVAGAHVSLSTVKFASSPRAMMVATSGTASTVTRANGSTVAQGYLSWNWQIVSADSASAEGAVNTVSLYDSVAAAPQLTLAVDAAGFGTLYLGASGSATVLGNIRVSVNVFHAITILASIGSSGWVQVSVDGDLQLDFTGNTQSTAHAYYDAIRFGGTSIGTSPTEEAVIDDVFSYSGLPSALTGTGTTSITAFSDNFDSYSTTTPTPWLAGGTGGGALSSTVYASASRSLELGNGGNTNSNRRAAAPFTTGSIQVNYRQASASSGTTYIQFWDIAAAAPQITIGVAVSGTCTVYRGSNTGTSLGTFTLGLDAFHLIKATVTIDGSAGSVAITADGTSVFSFSGNTKSTANAYFSGVEFQGTVIGPSPAGEAFADDVVVAGTVPVLSNSLWRGVTDLTAAPGAGAVTLTGFAPSVDVAVAPAAGAITVTGLAPSLSQAALPGAGGVTLSGFVPSADLTSAPGAGSVVLTGFAPDSALASAPGAGAIVFTGLAPALPLFAAPGSGALLLSGFAPSADLSSLPAAGQLLLTGFAPAFLAAGSAPLFAIIV